MYLSKSIFILTFSFLIFSLSYSQEIINRDKQIVGITGYSPTSIIFLGKTPSTTTTITKIEFRSITNKEIYGYPIYYQIGFIPYIEFDYPRRDEGNTRGKSKGFGISPLGLGITNEISRIVSISMYSYSGLILMDKRFPTDKGKKLNYTFSLSVNTILRTSEHISLSLGYKFHHISNAQTGKENPGVDSNFITLSLILSR